MMTSLTDDSPALLHRMSRRPVSVTGRVTMSATARALVTSVARRMVPSGAPAGWRSAA